MNPEVIKLYNFQVSLENSVTSILERLKKYPEFDLYEFSNDLANKRQNEFCNTIQTAIKHTLEPLKSKMALIKNKELGNITDFKQFKKEMILIQDSIQGLKYDNKRQLVHLNREADDLMEEINFYTENKLLAWTEPVQLNYFATNTQKPQGIKSRHQCKEAKEFMDFVHSSGGHENGWRLEDHHLFIKFRKKFKKIDIVSKKLHEELPDISIEDIKRHEEWYQKYINLELKKRFALKKWQKEKVNKTAVAKYSNVTSKIATVVQPSVNIREKLNIWKAQKEEQMKNAKETEVYNEQKRHEIEQIRRKRNEELKLLVQEWKERRQNLEEQKIAEKRTAEEHEKKIRVLEANRMIKQFQSQDDLYILKMKQKKKPVVFPIARSKSSHSAKRDPKRLLKPTQQWINRVHDDKPSDNFGKVIPLKCLPKLGVPEWRRKLE